MTHSSKVCITVDNIGPYHHARFEALSKQIDLIVIQTNTRSSIYQWQVVLDQKNYQVISLDQKSKQITTYTKIRHILKQHQPNVVFTSGWASSADIAAIIAAYFAKIPVIVMSESQHQDKKRNAFIEFSKKNILSLVQGVFAGGAIHKEYAMLLGIEPQFIRMGYDAVDNAHFEKAIQQKNQTKHCFISVSRLIEKKNHRFILQSFAEYVKKHSKQVCEEAIWRLKIAGDGPLKQELEELVVQLNISQFVDFLGYVEYDDLPHIYSESSVLVHLSLVEAWGLVVNEAMSAGLPVYVSSRCGCASELVRNEINGFILHKFDIEECANTLLQIATKNASEINAMGYESRKIINQWGLDNFATNFVGLVEAVAKPNLGKKVKKQTLFVVIAIIAFVSLRERYHGGIIE